MFESSGTCLGKGVAEDAVLSMCELLCMFYDRIVKMLLHLYTPYQIWLQALCCFMFTPLLIPPSLGKRAA